MEHAELFLLLPVYEEATDQPAYVKRVGVLGEEKYKELLTKLQDISLFFCYENYECYYDSRNLNAFMIPMDALRDCYPTSVRDKPFVKCKFHRPCIVTQESARSYDMGGCMMKAFPC